MNRLPATLRTILSILQKNGTRPTTILEIEIALHHAIYEKICRTSSIDKSTDHKIRTHIHRLRRAMRGRIPGTITHVRRKTHDPYWTGAYIFTPK